MCQLSLFGDTNDQASAKTPAIFTSAFEPGINLSHKIDAYYSSQIQKKRKSQRQLIYDCIKELIIASDREISIRTKIPRHLVPDRRGQLLKTGLIEIAREGTDPETGMKVTYYKIAKNLNQ